jgi:DNA-binding MarR family transcriptional regulator
MKFFKLPAYIRFLSYQDNSGLLSAEKLLDDKERQLLNHITLSFVKEKQLLVGDLIRLHELGSQATLYSRIKNLYAIGFIELTQDISDGRKKYVTPTAKAMKYYEKLSVCLEKALKNS